MNDTAQEKPPTSHVPRVQSAVSHDASPQTSPEIESDWTKDARSPLNWSSARNWTIVVVLAMTNFAAYVVFHDSRFWVDF